VDYEELESLYDYSKYDVYYSEYDDEDDYPRGDEND